MRALLSLCVLISSSKDTSQIELGPGLKIPVNLVTSLKVLCPNTVTFGGLGGYGFATGVWEEGATM